MDKIFNTMVDYLGMSLNYIRATNNIYTKRAFLICTVPVFLLILSLGIIKLCTYDAIKNAFSWISKNIPYLFSLYIDMVKDIWGNK